jgi:hypothetical protein
VSQEFQICRTYGWDHKCECEYVPAPKENIWRNIHMRKNWHVCCHRKEFSGPINLRAGGIPGTVYAYWHGTNFADPACNTALLLCTLSQHISVHVHITASSLSNQNLLVWPRISSSLRAKLQFLAPTQGDVASSSVPLRLHSRFAVVFHFLAPYSATFQCLLLYRS